MGKKISAPTIRAVSPNTSTAEAAVSLATLASGFISSVIKSEDEKPNTIQLNLDRYSTIDFGNFRYKILDDQGNYSPNWESNNTYYMIEVKKDQYEFKTSSLDDGEYYCIFKIYDVSNQYTYSKLVKIG